jgi:hypothetical protein
MFVHRDTSLHISEAVTLGPARGNVFDLSETCTCVCALSILLKLAVGSSTVEQWSEDNIVVPIRRLSADYVHFFNLKFSTHFRTLPIVSRPSR